MTKQICTVRIRIQSLVLVWVKKFCKQHWYCDIFFYSQTRSSIPRSSITLSPWFVEMNWLFEKWIWRETFSYPLVVRTSSILNFVARNLRVLDCPKSHAQNLKVKNHGAFNHIISLVNNLLRLKQGLSEEQLLFFT